MYTHTRKLLLASAVALALGTVGAAGAGESASLEVTEARQETQIWTTYALSPYLRANDLRVSVDKGKATLTGTVEESVNKDLAKQIALGVGGITDVDNQIVVKADYKPAARSSERSYGELIDDATITAAVKSKLAWSKHVDSVTTNVETKRGKVMLTGATESKMSKDLAGKLAMDTRGVVSVENQLQVGGAKPVVATCDQRARTWPTVGLRPR